MSNNYMKMVPVEFELPEKLVEYLDATAERFLLYDPKFRRDDLVADLLDVFLTDMVSAALYDINEE